MKKESACAFCCEEIATGAVKCQHCESFQPAPPVKPTHEGTCSYCKQHIHPDAVKCKYCKSWLTETDEEASSDFVAPEMLMMMGGNRNPKFVTSDFPNAPGEHYSTSHSTPSSWFCGPAVADWSTFNLRTRQVLMRVNCVDLYSGARRSRNFWRTVSVREFQEMNPS